MFKKRYFVHDNCGAVDCFVELTEKQYNKFTKSNWDSKLFVIDLDVVDTVSFEYFKALWKRFQ